MSLNIYENLPETYLKQTLNYEGGYVNDPSDSGGETCRGITIGALNRAKSQGLVSSTLQIKDLMTDLASVRKIYEVNYYKAGKCNFMAHPLAFAHFDACVNHGLGGRSKSGIAIGAGMLLQKTIVSFGELVNIDGSVGPLTLKALDIATKKIDIYKLAEKYNDFREEYFNNIAKANPKNKKFLKGWLNRLNSVRAFCKK